MITIVFIYAPNVDMWTSSDVLSCSGEHTNDSDSWWKPRVSSCLFNNVPLQGLQYFLYDCHFAF